jgi:hypothetical protein
VWSEGLLHSLFKATSEQAWEQCSVLGGTRLVSQASFVGNVSTGPLTAGTHYFFDDSGTNCIDAGLKVKVTVLPEGELRLSRTRDRHTPS